MFQEKNILTIEEAMNRTPLECYEHFPKSTYSKMNEMVIENIVNKGYYILSIAFSNSLLGKSKSLASIKYIIP
jgi:hypothetical protein